MARMQCRARSLAAILFSLVTAQGAAAVTIHDEGVNGDLSNNRLAPTALLLADGTSSIIATSVGGDREFFSVVVPLGATLQAVELDLYTTPDIAFIAIQSGATFTEDPNSPDVENILGYTHFGPGLGGATGDLLDDIGEGAGAIGFTPPLPAGTYTFWAQQTQGPTTYQLDFVVVVPEPGPGLLSGAALGALGLLARARRAR